MTQRKGLSQILYLIIAASVLMMVALSLIFMFNDSVSPGESNTQACTAAINTQCSATGATTVEVPTTCTTTNAQDNLEVINGISTGTSGLISGDPGADNFVANCN